MVVSWPEAGLHTGGLSQDGGGEVGGRDPWGASEAARGPWSQKARVGTGDLGRCKAVLLPVRAGQLEKCQS